MNWTYVKDGLPFEKYHGEKVLGEVLVTVKLKDNDINDENEVCSAEFNCEDQKFYYMYGDNLSYCDGDSRWEVIAWMDVPEAAK